MTDTGLNNHKKRWKWGRWLLGLLLVAALGMGAVAAVWLYKAQRFTERLETRLASQPYEGFAIGDLGGMPVKIPRHMAEMLEYDGDPGWAPAPDWLPPVRTFESKMNSFGFYVRFPDGATLDSRERREEKRLVPPWEDKWIDVGVASSKHYPGHGFLNRYVASRLHSHEGKTPLHQFYRQPQDEFGLEVYRLAPPPEGPDPMKTLVSEEFVARNASGRITSTFYCSTVPDVNRSMCSQVWSMEEQGLNIKISAQYRRPMLQHWREIQPIATQMVLGFRHTQPRTNSESSSPAR